MKKRGMLGEAFDVERRMRLTWHDGVWEEKALGGGQASDAGRSCQHRRAACGGFPPLQQAELGHNLPGN